MDEGSYRANGFQEMRNVVPADHQAAQHHEGCDRRTHQGEILPQQIAVEGQGRECTSAFAPSRLVGVIIRMRCNTSKLHLGMRLQRVERDPAGRKESLAQYAVAL